MNLREEGSDRVRRIGPEVRYTTEVKVDNAFKALTISLTLMGSWSSLMLNRTTCSMISASDEGGDGGGDNGGVVDMVVGEMRGEMEIMEGN